jgi:hypothetical protein
MRNLIIGIIIGMMITAPLAWAAAARRIVDTDNQSLDINSDGTLNIILQ